MFMIPMWALDDGEKIIGMGDEDGSVLTLKTNGDKREWTMKNGQIHWKLIKQQNLNPMGCCCSREESYTCTAPCGYLAQRKLEEKAKEKAKLKALLQDVKAMQSGGRGSHSSPEYKDGWYDAISIIEDRLLEEKP